jgi:hypothetical protein
MSLHELCMPEIHNVQLFTCMATGLSSGCNHLHAWLLVHHLGAAARCSVYCDIGTYMKHLDEDVTPVHVFTSKEAHKHNTLAMQHC